MTRLTLRAAHPASLASEGVADIVRATIVETAELHGVAPPTVAIFDDRVEMEGTLAPAVLLALATRVRSATGRWHEAKYGCALWQGE